MISEKNDLSKATELPATFKPIVQKGDFDDGFACVAMIVGKEIEEIRQLAIEKFRHPTCGPYWVGYGLIQKLLRNFGWNIYDYEPVSKAAGLPDLALLLVEYSEETDIGRLVLFHRTPARPSSGSLEYSLDPAYWIDEQSHVRLDFMKLKPAYYMEVRSTPKSVGGPR